MADVRAAPSIFNASAVELLFLQSGGSADLHIDMSVVTYIDLPTLPLLLSSIAARVRDGLKTTVEAPRDARTLDYLEAWNFFDQLEKWTGAPLRECLTSRTLSLLEDRRSSEHKNRYSHELFPKHSLPLTQIPFDADRPLVAAARERERWLRGPVQNVLRLVIGRVASKLVARSVIFEGIKNTAMHSGASLVYTTAQVQQKPDQRDQREFAVCIWDNGDSIVETLKSGFEKFLGITTPHYGQIVEYFTVDVFEQGTATYSYELTTEGGEPPEVNDELALMVSAFFFGVSADPRPRSDDDLPDADIADRIGIAAGGAEGFGGFGTYLITDTVAYQCGGSVEYFHGPYHLTFTTTGVPDSYSVKAEVGNLESSGVVGNLLVMRLPADAAGQPSGIA